MKEIKQSNIINCGYGKGFSVNDVLKIVNQVNDKPISIKNGDRRVGDPSMLVSNVSKLKKVIFMFIANKNTLFDDFAFNNM